MKLNKERQQMYLDGKVGLINDGTVEQLWEVANTNGYKGNRMFYHKNSTDLTKPIDGKEYHPIAWFYESETPKVGEWWECIDDVVMTNGAIKFIKGKKYICENDDCLTNEDKSKLHYMGSTEWIEKHFIKSTATETRKPTAWKLNIDVPEWDAKAGTVGINHKKYEDSVQFNNSLSPKSLLPYIATPIYGTKIKLESGAEIELSENDIENIKKL